MGGKQQFSSSVATGVTGTGGCWLAMRGKNENKTENFDAT